MTHGLWRALGVGSILFLTAATATAALHKLRPGLYQAGAKRSRHFIQKGVFIGGEASRPLSLLQVRPLSSKKPGWERILIQLGDDQGAPLVGKNGYFHVSIKKSQIVVDLSDVQRTRLDTATVKNQFKNSRVVRDAMMTMDPEDHSTNITFSLKSPSAATVYTPQNKRGERLVVIDLRPLKGRKRVGTR